MTDRQEYLRAYRRKPEIKEKYNEISKKLSKERKRKNTKKRLQEHTMDELMKIVKETCQEKNIEYDTIQQQYYEFMKFLHDPIEHNISSE